ncbi:uncharacterized protein LOC134684639 [Mytilus trossulus]|uniref:uncharacterized protein LOC134684639 n=1 Tax=Mytilus trossulus TaxID=6551 RepID=UPI0030051612
MNQKLRSIRAGYRSAVSRLIKKFEDVQQEEDGTVDTEDLSNILDSLKRKQETLRKLDEDIVQELDDGDIETEIVEADEYAFNLEDEGKLPIRVLIVPEIAAPLKTYIRKAAKLSYLSEIKLAHPVTANDNFQVSVLVGADYYWSIIENHIIRGDGPTAVKSKIGYLLSGPLHGTPSYNDQPTSMMNVMTSRKTKECDLEKFWKLETLGIEQIDEKETGIKELREVYEKTCISYHDNRYFATLPWKEEHPPLPMNKEIAHRRTENVITRLKKEPHLLQQYGKIIGEQERRGFIEKIDEDTVTSNRVHYIPHHAVKKESSTTPIRIEFDCSCKPRPETPSLNDCLMDTPPDLNELTGILLRFRLNQFAVSTDIEKAFFNVGLEEKDRDVTRFFWFSDPTDSTSPLSVYRFKSVLFGATCSPFILNAVVQRHLNENTCEWTDVIQKDLYIDNIISSFPTESQLLQYFDTSRILFAKAGFNLRSWESNNKTLQDRATSKNIQDNDKLIKVLGLRWNTDKDTLTFAKQEYVEMENHLITKREILRQSSKIYDPLGIISPITVRSTMFMQTLWEKKTGLG